MSYQHVEDLLTADRCVLLDGAVGTELPPAFSGGTPLDEEIWGTRALVEAPGVVRDVHRAYVRAGCDVVTTDTWGLASLARPSGEPVPGMEMHWMDVARRGVQVAREAAAGESRSGEVAVAFSLNAALDSPDALETVKLLSRALDDAPPDLILFETLSVVRPSLFAVVEGLLSTGLPVWMSFRRCRHGLCGVYGQHWGGPEGDAFGRAARRFEEMGVRALLVNCIPPDHVDGMMSYLRDFTDMALGAYPNLGYYSDQGWRSEPDVGDREYAELTLRWRGEGAQIIGGCCGVGPGQVAAARTALEGVPRGSAARSPTVPIGPSSGMRVGEAAPEPWADDRGRTLYPLPVPRLTLHPDVFAPTQGSLTVWRYLFNEQIGAGKRCLDVGCGAGLQTVQLALNGAAHVHGIDLEPAAAEYTLTNAFRNGVADRVTAATADLFSWVPDERYDVVVASLFQTPVDPLEQLSGHRPMDFWGRNLLDHLITKLPEALATDGVAYLLQLSILSQERTAGMLARHGLTGAVVDFGFFPIAGHFERARAQIGKVEGLSDAYHLDLGEVETMVAYVLKVARRP